MNKSMEQEISPLLVTAAVIIQEDHVLISLRPDHKPQGGLWEFPGGKLNPGESPEEALQRELKEELDLKIDVKRIIDALYYRYPWGPVLILAYSCRIIEGTPQNIEVADHCWAPLKNLHQFEFLAADLPLVNRLQRLK